MKLAIRAIAGLAMLLGCGDRTGLVGSRLVVTDGAIDEASDAAIDQRHDGAAIDTGTRDSALDGESCAPGETKCRGVCTAGPCPVTLATGYPLGIAADSTSVYWTNGDPTVLANIVKAPLAGGSLTTIWTAATGACSCDEPYALAVDATSIYWTTGRSGIVKLPLAGGRATTLVPGPSWTNQNPPYVRSDIALDDARVYWIVPTSCKNGGGMQDLEGAVLSVPLNGGVPTTIASGRGLSGGIAVDRTNVYWTEGTYLLERPLTGGTEITLAALGGSAFHLAVDAASVYWLATTGLMKVAIQGGSVETLVAGAMMSGASAAPFAFALDGSNLYWSAGRQATDALDLMKMPSSGGVPSTLVAGLTELDFFAFSASSVFWTEPVPGIVARLTPK